MSLKALPTAQAIAKLITSLVGKNVTAKPAAAAVERLPKGGVVGVCVDDTTTVVALVVADVPLAAAAGAALAMIPPAAAQDAVRAGSLPPNIADNFREVTNILCSVLTAASGRGVRLADFAVGSVPPAAEAVLGAGGARLDLEVDVQGYGKGQLAIICT
ncbi:hypothetical protein [Immundisolibacter sp.]|uniref:hypothetical protein n=1 Tax=Immundisolibacter sp. TaxID=1934948 RepID=UPI002622660D|nr:hypothetical protein [Immundisolibacter sp.]MDD3650110.1 hypothetical protein [Immundisolibacter sp.]